jgi:hypothetical protein
MTGLNEMNKVFYMLLIFIIISNVQPEIWARELCDCYGTCVPIYARDVNYQTRRMIRLRDGYKPYSYVEVDHKLPLCLGGTNKPDNLWALTPKQHKIKTEHDLLLLYYVRNCYMTVEEAQSDVMNFKRVDDKK